MHLGKPHRNGTRESARRWVALLLAVLVLSLPSPRAYAEQEEEEGGGKAAEILLSVAAILAPIMGMVAAITAAKEQANADKYIAKTAAEASMAQTNKQAEVTLSLAADQKQIAEKNLQATRELAERQEKNSKDRLLVQLAAIERERTALAAERAEIRTIEQKRANDQIAFAREQAMQNLQLAQLALNAQLVNQGLQTTGGASSSRLSNTATGATASFASSINTSGSGGGTNLFGLGASSGTGSGTGTGSTGSSSSGRTTTVTSTTGGSGRLGNGTGTGGNGTGTGTGVGTGTQTASGAGTSTVSRIGASVLGVARGTNASSALLASVSRGAVSDADAQRSRVAATEAVGVAYGTGGGLMTTAEGEEGMPPLLRQVMESNHNRIASTRGFHNLTADFESGDAEERESDLLRFAQDVTRSRSDGGDFTEFLSEERNQRASGASLGVTTPRQDDSSDRAYRPPVLVQEEARRHARTN